MITITRAPKLKIHCSTLIIHYQNWINTLGDLNMFKSISECNLITNKEIIKLVSILGDKKTKKISCIYERYSRYRAGSHTLDKYSRPTINKVVLSSFLKESKIILKALDLK